MTDSIKVGFCVAYDWELLRIALPLVYKEADAICLSLDNRLISWSGEPFQFDEILFQGFIKQIDVDSKIKVYKDNFYLPELTPIQNEVRQRNLMANFLGAGGWHIQLDCDEYFMAFNSFVSFLAASGNSQRNRTNICCNLTTIFKRVNSGFLVIDCKEKDRLESIAVATAQPNYEYGRRNGYFNVHTTYQILHQSWARSEKEIQMKVKNWGHKNDFDVVRFVDFWKHLDETNFHQVINFHPIDPPLWPSLQLVEAGTIDELLHRVNSIPTIKLSAFELKIKNSRLISKLAHAWRQLIA